MSLPWDTPAALVEARDAAACCPSGGEADGRSATGLATAAAAGTAEDGARRASSAGDELSARTICGAVAVAAVTAAAGAGSSFTPPSTCTKNAMIPTIAPTQTRPAAGHFHP